MTAMFVLQHHQWATLNLSSEARLSCGDATVVTNRAGDWIHYDDPLEVCVGGVANHWNRDDHCSSQDVVLCLAESRSLWPCDFLQ